MAQAGYTPISLYYSTTASTAPTSGNLVNGELAINITDGKLYYKDNGGTVQIIASKAGASGDVVGPASATDNAIVRFDGTTGKLVQNSVVTIADSTGDISGVGQLNATTLDATNIEVTNIKAKDGTAAASIADSTGVISVTANPVLSGGTANGVLYLDGSKVATSGSALTFDGSTFSVAGEVRANATFRSSDGTNIGIFGSNVLASGVIGVTSSNNIPLAFGVAATEQMRLTSTGLKSSIAGTNADPVFSYTSDTNTGIFFPAADKLGFTAGGGTDQMVLTTTGLGIGTSSPKTKLDVSGNVLVGPYNTSTNYATLSIKTASTITTPSTFTNAINIWNGTSVGEYSNITFGYNTLGLTNASAYIGFVSTSSANSGKGDLVFGTRDVTTDTAATERMRLDSSGNLGLGVTPSAWTLAPAFELKQSGVGIWNSGNNDLYISNNAYYNSGWKYGTSSVTASQYRQTSGQHQWFTAPSGTAGNAITFTQAMTLDASGNLSVGTTAANGKITVSDNSTYQFRIGYAVSSDRTLNLRADTGYNASISFTQEAVADRWAVGTKSGDGSLFFSTGSDLATGTERARITSGGLVQVSSGGSVQIGDTAARATTAGTNRLDIFNGTAPVGTLSNGISIYSSSGEAYVMDAAGNATLFSPHDAETNEWIFKSKHTPTGKTLKIDVEKLLRFINDHFGLDAVHEFIEP